MNIRNPRSLGLAAAVISLMMVAFVCGFGVRQLYALASGTRPASGLRFVSASTADPDLRPSTLLFEAYRKLQIYYVEPLPSDPTPLAYGSIQGMLELLDDPNTRLLTPEDVELTRAAINGHLRGLGAWLTIRKGKPAEGGIERFLTVVSALPGSPAEKAGLRSGDRITYLDGKWVVDRHLSPRELLALQDSLMHDRPPPRDGPAAPESPRRRQQREEAELLRRRWLNHIEITAAQRLLMSADGEHELTIERAGAEKPVVLKIQFAPTEVKPLEERRLNAQTAYVRLPLLNDAAAQALESRLAAYGREGVKNLVLDLRQSPGGSLAAAARIASAFIPRGEVVVLKERNAERKPVLRPVQTRPTPLKTRPTGLTVMVDEGTAGASEVLAAALRDNLGIKLVGARTFGDGTAQEIVPLENGAALSITRAYLLTPKARASFAGRGLTPDSQAAAGEAGLATALKALAPVARPATRAAARQPA